ncbi:MAG TPA: hypothetical protein VIH05_06575 [Tepidiformaceae bacterium]
MATATRFPQNASVYELIRARPGARARLSRVGLTREHLDYRLGDAAEALGVPVEQISELVRPDSETAPND